MQEDQSVKIKVVTKKAYGILAKLFCCRCFHCLQADDISMLTSDIRKQTFHRMIKNFQIQDNIDDEKLFDTLKLMIIIYLCEDQSIPHRLIQRCRINPVLGFGLRNRTDIQFYIPQICNFLVFHEDLTNTLLMDDMVSVSKLNYFFGHLYYFYMNSLSKIVGGYDEYTYGQVTRYNQQLLDLLCKDFGDLRLIAKDFYLGATTRRNSVGRPAVMDTIRKYGTVEEDECNRSIEVQADDIALPNYYSIYAKEAQYEPYSFKSVINFFQDLFLLSSDIKTANPKTQALKHLLKKMNEKLPAAVYVPFARHSLRLYNVLNIVTQEARVFSTKQRAPFYICLQIFNPAESLSEQQQKNLETKINKAVTIKLNAKRTSELTLERQSREQPPLTSFRNTADAKVGLMTECRHTTQFFHGNVKGSGNIMNNKMLQFSDKMQMSKKGKERDVQLNESTDKGKLDEQNFAQKLGMVFGLSLQKMNQRIRKQSIFGKLKSWRLLHMMVKTGDNLKQEQFALQLISQFNNIFKLQSVPLLLTPYEVLSLGPDCGVMEMLKDTITMDGLLKKIKENSNKIHSLKEFFQAHFVQNLHKAKINFTRSLAAYSLVMYFMQVKDRHNGNILLHRDGRVIHIDFGFFLSNAPGKGVQLEKSAPFKLNSNYLEVMDGHESQYFEEFRKLFYQGFQAARKHQDKILILVKMMYSSSGTTMPCFEKGQLAIKQLENRFNPPDIMNDLLLSQHCQKLINWSLDNWATRWYDKWQYWAQGIFY